MNKLAELDASNGCVDTNVSFRQVAGEIVAIDDDLFALNALHRLLSEENYGVLRASNGTQGLQLITESTAVALVDLRMPDLSGIDCLRFIRENFPSVQVIILTGSAEVADAVEAMREGAFQYVTKPFDPKQLIVYIQKGFEAWKAAINYRDLKESHCHTIPVNVVDGKGDYHSELMRQIERIAGLDSTVFIGGESGTGKSTVARLIHQQSARSEGPFVTVNCASLPRELIQSELFGHTRGAFTGAVKDRAGHAEVADEGTLFLDEIGDLPLDLQPKLLTFLQDRTIQRLGTSEVRKVDVRLIVATHRDLAAMCREGRFRQDLFYRLMVLNVELRPLRHRLQEVPGLTQGILDAICARMELPPKHLSLAAERRLLCHDWPGNIRELENVLERAVAFSFEDRIDAEDIRFSITSQDSRSELFKNSGTDSLAGQSDIQKPSRKLIDKQSVAEHARPVAFVARTLQEIEREAILQTLIACRGNKAKTARILGISEKSIYNKMHRLNIDMDETQNVATREIRTITNG